MHSYSHFRIFEIIDNSYDKKKIKSADRMYAGLVFIFIVDFLIIYIQFALYISSFNIL